MRTQPLGGPGSEPIRKEETKSPKQITNPSEQKTKEVSQTSLKTFEKTAIEREIETLHNRIDEVVDNHEKSTQETREISERIFELEQKLSNLEKSKDK